ncbi:MAG: 16S rRNA (guanine(527)-N(7))-methyltransferase RsmG [Candidatus Peribacteraceae bacterium]
MINPALESRLRELVTVFLAENAKLNLSAFRTEEQCWTGNVLDSLAALELPPFTGRVLDLGTGGGFPMLPLALALPDVRCAGLDSVQKKVDATNRIIAAMNMQNAQCLCGRTEVFGRMPEHRERYDAVLARGVAEITVLLEYASPFLKPGGRIVLWKSMNVEEELKESGHAQKELYCRLLDRHVYELPGDWGKRQLLVFEKTAHLSGKYPREVGVPKKKPLR